MFCTVPSRRNKAAGNDKTMLNRTLHRSALLGSLLAVPLLLGATTAKADYENCEEARQEYCYGEGNAMLDCFEQTGTARAACFRGMVNLCETVLVKTCEDLPGAPPSGGSGSTSRMYEVTCPGGTAPDLLGRCVTILKARPDAEDKDPNDWCPAGEIVGPHGNCIPDISVARFTPTTDGWYLACPSGMEPGPIGGCVKKFTGNGGVDFEGCPPGESRGPAAKCVPDFLLSSVGNMFGSMLLDMLSQGDRFEQFDAGEFGELLAAGNVVHVENPEVALEQLAEELAADVEVPAY